MRKSNKNYTSAGMEDMKDDVTLWDKEDDNYLRTIVSLHGEHNWTAIAINMNVTFPSKNRTAQECKERWYSYLDPTISKEPWTDQEELEMLIAHQKHQNKWSDVAQALKGRSNNTIKNRFYSIFRKVKNKIKRRDLAYGSKLELLEIFYMISLMEFYFTHPPVVPEQKGKRGKDFIYSLLRTIRLDDVIKYKADLQKLGNKETTFEELWLEMANQGGVTGAVKPETGEKPIDLFPVISDQASCGGINYSLPLPHAVTNPQPLTTEEKDFVQYQAFSKKEPSSAGSYSCQPMITSPSDYQPATFSAGHFRLNPSMSRYEVFSDFADGAHPPQAPAYSQYRPLPMHPARLPQGMRQIQFPLQSYRHSFF